MPIQTFTNSPLNGSSLAQKPAVDIISFGDGYEQRVGRGINNARRIWSLTFTPNTKAEANTILSFLQTHGALTAFLWTPPIGIEGRFVCREWNQSIVEINIYSITATFEEVFE